MTNEQLVARIKAHENESENMKQLWIQMERLIGKIASRYKCFAEFDDLKQEGYFGLCEAVEHYDFDKGVKFSTYAGYWIKQSIQRSISNSWQSVRIPENALNNVWKYKRVVADFMKEYGTKPPDRYVALMLGVSMKELETIKENIPKSKTTSLNVPVGEDDGEITLEQTIASSYDIEEDCIARIDHDAMSKELWSAVDELPINQREAIKKKYVDGMTLQEIGADASVDGSAIAVRINTGLRRLRGGKHSKSLRSYYDVFFPTISVNYKGVNSFNRDWTSTTEQSVLWELKLQERIERQLRRKMDKSTTVNK